MPTAEVDGAQLAYKVDGQGPALVLVHAGIADMRMWDPLVALLDHRFRVVRYDMRGHGETTYTAGESSDADDLVQVTVEKCLQYQASWRPGTKLDSWMFTVMRNAWTDENRLRARQFKMLAPFDGAEEEVADPAGVSQDMRAASLTVAASMARLPREQRLAVALVLIEGLSYREAAAVLEIPEGTLTSRLVRGRMALLSMLGPERFDGHH